MKKVNVHNKLDIEALARRGDGSKAKKSDVLTEGEKVQVALMMERLNLLQNQLAQVRQATSELITSIVEARGLDPKKYGVNLAAGKVLPVGVLPVGSEEDAKKD